LDHQTPAKLLTKNGRRAKISDDGADPTTDWRSMSYHILITRDGHEMKLPPYLGRNPEFQQWISNLLA
jgi:hypothetical protein